MGVLVGVEKSRPAMSSHELMISGSGRSGRWGKDGGTGGGGGGGVGGEGVGGTVEWSRVVRRP